MGKTPLWLGMVLSGSIALSMPSCASAQQRDSFDFATARSGSWELRATTRVNWPTDQAGRQPSIASIDCSAESPDFRFSMNDVGALSFFKVLFLGPADKEGNREEITLLGDHLWLYVDGERWEFANIHARSSAFSNLHYPPPESGDVILTWRGHAAVRKTERDPWLHLSRLYERLINARKIEWGFKSRNWKNVDSRIRENQLPAGWNLTRYPVDNRGLRDAVLWCTRQISSDAAYILPTPAGQVVSPTENGRPG